MITSHYILFENLMNDLRKIDKNVDYQISKKTNTYVIIEIRFSLLWIETKKKIINIIKSYKDISLIDYKGIAATILVPFFYKHNDEDDEQTDDYPEDHEDEECKVVDEYESDDDYFNEILMLDDLDED